ncbi:MAG: hypothetical protein K1X86_15565 [Ignavibacteria bacterium]|nr:hypothetical protein [Ignavibacteria bacterium]
MVYTPDYIESLFKSEDISGKAIERMIEAAGLTKIKTASGVNIKQDYLSKIIKDKRKAVKKRNEIKTYCYKVALASNNVALAV